MFHTTVSVAPSAVLNFFIWRVAIPHKYIFQLESVSSSKKQSQYYANLMSSSTKISGVFLACLKSSMDFRSSSLFSSFLSYMLYSKKKLPKLMEAFLYIQLRFSF
jgi:hypothetical protein